MSMADGEIDPQVAQKEKADNFMSGIQGYTGAQVDYSEDTDSVASRINRLVEQNSPMMQAARLRSDQQMHGRGLVNSSMAHGAAELAVYDTALPIAQTDAQHGLQAAMANQDSANRGMEFTAGQKNQGLFMNRQAEIDQDRDVLLHGQAKDFETHKTTEALRYDTGTTKNDMDAYSHQTTEDIRRDSEGYSFQERFAELQTRLTMMLDDNRYANDRGMQELIAELQKKQTNLEARIQAERDEILNKYARSMENLQTSNTEERMELENRLAQERDGSLAALERERDILLSEIEKELDDHVTKNDIDQYTARTDDDIRRDSVNNTFDQQNMQLQHTLDLLQNDQLQGFNIDNANLAATIQKDRDELLNGYEVAAQEIQDAHQIALENIDADNEQDRMREEARLTAERDQKLADLEVSTKEQLADIEIKLANNKRENDEALVRVQGEVEQALVAARGEYDIILEANDNATALYESRSDRISDILADGDIELEQKQQLIDLEVELLQSGLAVIGGMSNLDIPDLLDWGRDDQQQSGGFQNPQDHGFTAPSGAAAQVVQYYRNENGVIVSTPTAGWTVPAGWTQISEDEARSQP